MFGKSLKCLAALSLVLALLSGACFAEEPHIPFLDWLIQMIENARPADAVETDSTGSIWDKRVSYTETALPDRAFAQGGRLCAGMTADGTSFLIVNEVMPHFWNINTGLRTWLYPADEQAEEIMRMFCAPERTQPKATEAQIEAYYQKHFGGREGFSSLSGKDLLKEYLSTEEGVPFGPRGVQYVHTDIRYMITQDNYGISWAVDTQTGAMYCCDGETGGIYNGELLSYRFPGTTVTLTSLENGKSRTVDFSAAFRFESGSASLKAALFLPDGSIAAVLRDISIDPKNGQQCALAIYTPDGIMETYFLGRIRFGLEPTAALAVDEDSVVLFSGSLQLSVHPYLINRKTGEVSVLSSSASGLSIIRVEECTFQEGKLILPEAYSGDASVALLSRIDDTLLLYNLMDSRYMLLKPSTGESRYLFSDPTAVFPIGVYFFTDHHDRIYLMSSGSYFSPTLIDLR